MSADQHPRRDETSDPGTWLDDHGDALFRYAMAHLNNRAAAEDAVQETLVGALVARKNFTGQSSLRTWLIGILKHKVVDQIRKSSREQSIAPLESTAEYITDCFNQDGYWTPGPRNWGKRAKTQLEQQEFWEAFRFCVSRLPPLLAGAFLMRETAELASEEICKLLKVSTTNLWTMLHRARTRLRACLEANWFGHEP
jgi:RNA polymerase sigma-70 factor (ECF subfamily)